MSAASTVEQMADWRVAEKVAEKADMSAARWVVSLDSLLVVRKGSMTVEMMVDWTEMQLADRTVEKKAWKKVDWKVF